MKEKIEKFGIYLLIGLAGLGYIMLRAGLKNDNSIFSIIGIILMLIGAAIFGMKFLVNRSQERKIEKKINSQLEVFKLKAQKIKVNLEDVAITSNQWTDEIRVHNTEYSGLDDWAGNHDANYIKVGRNLNAVKIEIPVDGKMIDYYVNIEMDPTTLTMHFALKKETFLYVIADEQYLDLEFLNKN